MKIFLCYKLGEDQEFVGWVHRHLEDQPTVESCYYYSGQKADGEWKGQTTPRLNACDAFVAFWGRIVGAEQTVEVERATEGRKKQLLVRLPAAAADGKDELGLGGFDPITVEHADARGALDCARMIVDHLELGWVFPDGVPGSYLYDYEKEIIDAYAGRTKLKPGSPRDWPTVERHRKRRLASGLKEVVGDYRHPDARVLVDARASETPARAPLTFREAGPRAEVSLPADDDPYDEQGTLRVGIVVSGGIAPGINAVVESIVERHRLYQQNAADEYRLRVRGYVEGFKALLQTRGGYMPLIDDGGEIVPRARGISHIGGSILGTSRAEQLLSDDPASRAEDIETILRNLTANAVRVLYVIGGDGSMRAAHAIAVAAERRRGPKVTVVAVPKTMDNDILWVWQAFGFLSAVDRARDAIFHLATEVRANPRLCVIQLFGSDSGFVVSHAALASGAGTCDLALIPELRFSMEKVIAHMRKQLSDRFWPQRGRTPHGVVVMAETAVPTDVENYLDADYVGLNEAEKTAIASFLAAGRRVQGQTPDDLRTGGLKVVSRVLEHAIQSGKLAELSAAYWRSFRVFTNEPRHLIRAAPPSVGDVVVGQRLGALAVDNAMAGYTDFMVSQWLTEYVLVPLELVVLGRKRVPLDGIFWKSVLATTGQPTDLA